MLTDTQRARLAREQSKALQTGRVGKSLFKLVCLECCHDPKEPGNVNAQIRACTCESCPLHAIRELWT